MSADGQEPVSGSEGRPSARVVELPLFPLDLVLFPYMPQHLHIFEERYKEMVNRCVRESLPFGIVLATSIDGETGDTQTEAVGCTARIARVERLPEGRMNIEVIGEERFRILDTHEQLTYRVGLTEPFADDPSDAALVVPLADEVQKLLRDYLTRTLALHGQSVSDFELPDEPEQLSYTAAWVLPIENVEKQALLTATDTAARLTATRDVLLREVTRLRRTAEAATDVIFRPIQAERLAPYRSPN